MRPLAATEITRDTTKNRSAWAPHRPFGFICPGCLLRYGAAQADGMIDVKRCPTCHKTLAEVHQHDEAVRSRQRHWREKVSRK